MNTAELGEEGIVTEGLVNLFKVLSKPEALAVFLLAGEGIKNSALAIEELGFSPKKYYARLRELVDIGFVTKTEGAYRQTPFGSIFCGRLLPAMGRAYDARDRLGLIAKFKGTQIEDEVRNLIENELNLPDSTESTNVKLLRDYEALAIEVIDLYDSAEERVLLASNYLDARVLDAVVRSLDRGVKNRCIIGKEILSSKLQQIRMLLSPKFTMSMMRLASNSIDLSELARVMDLHFSFCVVDGDRSIFEFYNPVKDEFIIAFLVKDSFIGEKLTQIFNELWENGECHSTLSFLSSFKA